MRKTTQAALAAAAILLAAAPLTALAQTGPAAPAALALSEQFEMRSEKIGQTFLIQVAKPIVMPAAGGKAPTIYATDGLLTLGLLTSATRAMPAGQGHFPPAYVVAIGYPEAQALQTTTLRLRDLTHQRTEQRTGPAGGGGGAFEDFLLNEVKPEIERRYAADPARSILFGHSLGGLFAARVLASHPDAFSGYVIGSPSMQYDEALPAAVRAAGGKGGGRRVFIGVGDQEPAAAIPRADALEQALAGSAFRVKRKTFADESHTSVLGALASAGLRYVLDPPPPPAGPPPAQALPPAR